MAQDSSKPDFWESRYRDKFTPWDAGGVPSAFKAYASTLPAQARILIPGCGSAYEAAWLADRGFDVLAIDFSPAAVDSAKKVLGRHAHLVRHADFFDFESGAPFDAIYERAFLCALPRKMWQAYAPRCAQVLKPGGVIAGFYFFAQTPKGPPFGTSEAELAGLMEPMFRRMDDRPVDDSIDVFAGKERWQVWKRS